MAEISNRLALNPHKVLENVPYSDWTEKLNQRFRREEEVKELKETYPKNYLFKRRLVTRREYATIKGHSMEYLRRKQINTF
jgi:hypothetical protein